MFSTLPESAARRSSTARPDDCRSISPRSRSGVPSDIPDAALAHGKASAAGLILRADLLAAAGIAIPRSAHDALGTAALDDVYDAAAMAWTARRVARGEAGSLPDGGEAFSDGVASAIWC